MGKEYRQRLLRQITMNNPIILMATGAILIAFSPILTKAVGLQATPIGFYRFFFATLTTTLYLIHKKNEVLYTIDKKELRAALPYMALAGLFFSIDLFFWNRSILSVGSGVATLLANTQVFYLAFIGALLFKERLNLLFYPALVLSIFGVSLTSSPYIDISNLSDKGMGIIYGLLTGMSYSLVTLCLRKANDYFKGKQIIIIYTMTFFAMVFSLLFSLIEGSLEIIKSSDLIYMIIYGSLIHIFGWLFISRSIKVIPIALASLLLLLQPICATVLGYFIYTEELELIQILGMVISLLGIYLAMRARNS